MLAPAVDVTAAERAQLAELEQIVSVGLGAFLAVGRALTEIRDRKLYTAAGYDTWHGYLRQRWDLSESRGHQLMASAATADALVAVGAELPPSESHVRELSPAVRQVGAERVAHAWAEIVASGVRITNKALRAALRARGLPVAGHGHGDHHAVRLDQLASTLAALRSRVEPLHRQREQRQLDPNELERLADEAEALSQLLHALAQPALATPEPEPLPEDEMCVNHGAGRLADGRRAQCGRHDLAEHERALPAAA
jgi:hypothetical protein